MKPKLPRDTKSGGLVIKGHVFQPLVVGRDPTPTRRHGLASRFYVIVEDQHHGDVSILERSSAHLTINLIRQGRVGKIPYHRYGREVKDNVNLYYLYAAPPAFNDTPTDAPVLAKDEIENALLGRWMDRTAERRRAVRLFRTHGDGSIPWPACMPPSAIHYCEHLLAEGKLT